MYPGIQNLMLYTFFRNSKAQVAHKLPISLKAGNASCQIGIVLMFWEVTSSSWVVMTLVLPFRLGGLRGGSHHIPVARMGRLVGRAWSRVITPPLWSLMRCNLLCLARECHPLLRGARPPDLHLRGPSLKSLPASWPFHSLLLGAQGAWEPPLL